MLDALEQDGLIARAEALGARILRGLRERLAGNNRVRDIRGLGLMIGVELADACGELVTQGLADGILINVTRDNVVRLLPPLTLSDAEADAIVERVAALVSGDRG